MVFFFLGSFPYLLISLSYRHLLIPLCLGGDGDTGCVVALVEACEEGFEPRDPVYPETTDPILN